MNTPKSLAASTASISFPNNCNTQGSTRYNKYADRRNFFTLTYFTRCA